MLLVQFSLSAQNDGYQKAGNNNNNQRDNYATPGDQARTSDDDDEKEDALQGGNFTIGSGFGYVNAVTTIQIDNGNTVQKGGNQGYQLHLTPTIGYFITRNWVFGLGMDYLVSSSKDNNDNTSGTGRTSDTKILFGPYSRIYFPFAGDQALFLGGVYAYGKSATEITDDTGTQNVNTTLITYGVGPGYAIFSNGRVSLETQVKYNYGISRNNLRVANTTQTTRTLTTAWDFVVGMHFYFRRNRS
ncbi:MAG: hypothetical protein H7246_02560 [Phycisphaerae bacterium]|nr:hypothetical protein [Saprospiraceae bacterium]